MPSIIILNQFQILMCRHETQTMSCYHVQLIEHCKTVNQRDQQLSPDNPKLSLLPSDTMLLIRLITSINIHDDGKHGMIESPAATSVLRDPQSS